MRSLFIFIFIYFFYISVFANVEIINSKIGFTSIGTPSFIRAGGEVPLSKINLKITGETLSGTATVALSELTSGIQLRDQHLKEKYLHINKFPNAEISFLNQKILFNGKALKIKGRLRFHGKEKPVVLKAKFKNKKHFLFMESEFSFLLSDFGVELPSFQGITAADKVKLSVKAQFKVQ